MLTKESYNMCIISPPSCLHHNTFVLVLEPLDSIVLGDSVLGADSSWSDLSLGDSVSWADEDDVEVHAEDTGGRIVLQTQVDVFSDTEAEASGVGEVLLLQFELLHLQGAVKDLVGLEATDSDVHGDLLVSADAEGSDGVAS